MQLMEKDLQKIFIKVASCVELGIPFRLEYGFVEKKKIGFFTRKERTDYEPCFILTFLQEEGTNNEVSEGGFIEGEEGTQIPK